MKRWRTRSAALLLTGLVTLVGCQSTPATSTLSVTLEVAAGQPVGGVKRIETTTGSTVQLKVTSDEPDTIHVHGYEVEIPVGPTLDGEAEFVANLPGTYEIETHASPNVIAQLVVR